MADSNIAVQPKKLCYVVNAQKLLQKAYYQPSV